ncbi:MAG: C-GCAxxG-C-C family protein [Anaerolineaceae bacterium]|nr:C-GCAxxG-C-C family protein [Anaerolineaceae bacterium]
MSNNSEKQILIWGAGRIGRGFIGDIFADSGYQLNFVDAAQPLVDLLNEQGVYTVVRAFNADNIQRIPVTQFKAYHVSQKDALQKLVNEVDVIAIATFPRVFDAVAAELQKLILARRSVRPNDPLDIIICTNLVHAGPVFSTALYQGLDAEQQAYFDEKIGVVESLIIRMAPPAPADEVEKDPLVVWTNGYAEFPVDASAFKAEPPKITAFRLVTDMRAEEQRKMYTYNMCHAVLGYQGYQDGYKLLVDCLADPKLRAEAEGALGEVSTALQKQYGFTAEAMAKWVEGVIDQTNNPSIGDTVARMAADPLRKLKKADRLIGPSLLCLKNDVEPVHLIRAIAYALHFRSEDDPNSIKLTDDIKNHGLEEALKAATGLGEDPLEKKLTEDIKAAYQQAGKDIDWREKAKEAYDLGFKYETVYHGCGQCSYAATSEILGTFDPEVFKAATGLCGGIGLKNNNTCSAFTGAVLAIGNLYNRRREHFDGDRESKYQNFDLVQQLYEKFTTEFGGITCAHIHTLKYGRPYDLSVKAEGAAFEEAGGHGPNGCTDTVGKACQFAIEVLAPMLMEKEEE